MGWRRVDPIGRMDRWAVRGAVRRCIMSSELWQQLTATALLGTAKQPLALPGEQGQVGTFLVHGAGRDPEGALRGGGAGISLPGRGGQLPASRTRELPQPAEAEALPACKATSLRVTLESNLKSVLPEWLKA